MALAETAVSQTSQFNKITKKLLKRSIDEASVRLMSRSQLLETRATNLADSVESPCSIATEGAVSEDTEGGLTLYERKRLEMEYKLREAEIVRQREKDEREYKLRESEMARQPERDGKKMKGNINLEKQRWSDSEKEMKQNFGLRAKKIQANLLITSLNEKAKTWLHTISADGLKDYGKIKKLILREFKLNPTKLREEFFALRKQKNESYTKFGVKLYGTLNHYFQSRNIMGLEDAMKLICADRMKELISRHTLEFIVSQEQAASWISHDVLAQTIDKYKAAMNIIVSSNTTHMSDSSSQIQSTRENKNQMYKSNGNKIVSPKQTCFSWGKTSHIAKRCKWKRRDTLTATRNVMRCETNKETQRPQQKQQRQQQRQPKKQPQQHQKQTNDEITNYKSVDNISSSKYDHKSSGGTLPPRSSNAENFLESIKTPAKPTTSRQVSVEFPLTHASLASSTANERSHTVSESLSVACITLECPSHELLKDNNFIWHKYNSYRANCLKDCRKVGIGQSTEMNTLFRFWSFFLLPHFHRKMYEEFRQLAIEDANKEFSDYQNGQLYGLEKFWAFLKYSRKHVLVDGRLRGWLSKYQRLEDFRVDFSVRGQASITAVKCNLIFTRTPNELYDQIISGGPSLSLKSTQGSVDAFYVIPKTIWNGQNTAKNGVGIFVREPLAQEVLDIKRINSRLMWIKLRIEKQTDYFFCIPKSETILIGGDLNGHVGEKTDGFDNVHGGFGYGKRNEDGNRILEFAESHGFCLLNTYFRKRRRNCYNK
ncbi:hypothetical protein HELRODRAFT_174304 [Helobdella robusta]|uniref:Uncharacterized protein n=1 Tax=Helobdella robusta TaxID=6412 RepID=T1F7Z2_HELRO|nr:hypothetical protein HELRODRAFT_174304 [Helobdella robusta]ESO02868.1 hypothetical protein HELRODRAFT_174304 [Helobdella robusta]